jgi:lipoprotein NlpD
VESASPTDTSKPTETPAESSTVAAADDNAWAWPTQGKVIKGFSESGSARGIDIAGTMGQPIHAASPGKVIYSGEDLRGYGKLVIIKHDDTFLSVYAHNSKILVKEGQQVLKGQKIAEMGNTDTDQVKLHFEIRQQGKSVDPMKYLSGNSD